MDANLIKNLKKDLIKLRSQIWDKMSDAQKEQYYQDEANNAISVENIISFLHEYFDRIKKEIDNPNFQDLFNRRLEMKITCFDNFWEELNDRR
jgi:conjugal transfer/entry exclusion protein